MHIDMSKKKPIPEQFDSVEAAADFWDSHSLADYWDQTHEVEIEVRAQRRRRVTLDPEVWEQIVDQARIRGVSPETLVNLWLMERVQVQALPIMASQRVILPTD
jgi:predicted alpha-1,6-mannanase (GH76 family)